MSAVHRHVSSVRESPPAMNRGVFRCGGLVDQATAQEQARGPCSDA